MAQQKQQEEERKFIFTTKLVEEITSKINDGVVIKRFQKNTVILKIHKCINFNKII